MARPDTAHDLLDEKEAHVVGDGLADGNVEMDGAGPLDEVELGDLVVAVASIPDARVGGGSKLVLAFDIDLDTPRVAAVLAASECSAALNRSG